MIDQTSTSEIVGQDADIDETQRLISSSKVEGTNVYNLEGAHIGSVDSFMVDKLSGKVSYAVMSFGGFLGIGERYNAAMGRAGLRSHCGRICRQYHARTA